MEEINKLKNEIIEIEQNIDENATKEELYDILVVAYFKAKDIIELYNEVNMNNTEAAGIKQQLEFFKQACELEAVKLANAYTELYNNINANLEAFKVTAGV